MMISPAAGIWFTCKVGNEHMKDPLKHPIRCVRSAPHGLLSAGFLMAFGCLYGQRADAVVRTEDVPYGHKFGMALPMDIFQPAKPNGAGLLFLVNGGWLSSKDTPMMVTIQPDYYRPYLERGYTVFAVVTSSQPRFTIPEAIMDVHRAVRFVRFNATKYGVQARPAGRARLQLRRATCPDDRHDWRTGDDQLPRSGGA